MRRRLAIAGIAGAALASLLAAGLFAARERMLDLALERFARGILAEPEMLRDGRLHLVLCGTGGPAGDREQRSACNAVVADGEMILVDVGGGGTLLASGLGLPLRQLSTILVTHLHHDHVAGIGDAIHGSWFLGRQRPVAVYGPPGIEGVVRGFTDALAEDRRLRQLEGGGGLDARWALPSVHVVELAGDAAVPVFERGRWRVSAFAVDHGPVEPSYGYRVELGGRVLVFAGDGRADERVVRHARGADLLVHATVGFQFLLSEARIRRVLDRLDLAGGFPDPMRAMTLFSSPVEVARAAQSAGVATLVFSHHPPIPPGLGSVFLWGVSDAFDGKAEIGREGMRFAWPTGSGSSSPGASPGGR